MALVILEDSKNESSQIGTVFIILSIYCKRGKLTVGICSTIQYEPAISNLCPWLDINWGLFR